MRLTVTVKTHQVRLSKIEAWLESGGRSPNEHALKVRLRELLGSGERSVRRTPFHGHLGSLTLHPGGG